VGLERKEPQPKRSGIDSPYTTLIPHRGKLCEPAYTKNTAEAIANNGVFRSKTLSQETEEVAQNFFRIS